LKRNMPPLDFTYTASPLEDPDCQDFVAREVDADSLANLPGGIEADYHWVDLDGEGIGGVLTEQGGEWVFKRNSGNGRFGGTHVVTPKPSLAAIASGQQRLIDLAGDGKLDLVNFGTPASGFYERTEDWGWTPFRAFESFPSQNWND